jgi:hypothetical protein
MFDHTWDLNLRTTIYYQRLSLDWHDNLGRHGGSLRNHNGAIHNGRCWGGIAYNDHRLRRAISALVLVAWHASLKHTTTSAIAGMWVTRSGVGQRRKAESGNEENRQSHFDLL